MPKNPENVRPSFPPASPPTLDGAPLPQPHPGAVLAWRRDGDGWRSTWALPSRGGLAVQFTPAESKRVKGFNGKFNLAILHEPTGLLVAHTDSGGGPIPHTPANLRKVQAMINDLLAVPVDWMQTFDNITDEERAAYREIVKEAQTRHLPGKPSRRATKLA